MGIITLTAAYMRFRPLNTVLNLLLLALGIGTLTVLLLFSIQFEKRLARDARGIDLVVGAKGSPLQLVLSGVYHMDSPTDMLPEGVFEALNDRVGVARALPIHGGGRFGKWRVIATTPEYTSHYGAGLRDGRLWEASGEAVIGAAVARRTGLAVGSPVAATFGDKTVNLEVVGVLRDSGTVLDRLIMTGLDLRFPPGQGSEAGDTEEVRLSHVLVTCSSVQALQGLKRELEGNPDLTAASPGDETRQLAGFIGLGLDSLRGLGLALIFAAALGIFIALYNAMHERRGDLAIMRCLGASRINLMMLVMTEGMLITGMGTLAGLCSGHIFVEMAALYSTKLHDLGLSGLAWQPQESWLLLLALSVGALAALLPAIQAYRTDIARTLAGI
ncbi:MAG: ABC transporter permease [Acidobacteriota bacterium]|nr:ABC transporter permease [Acidobacteriota bacterium]